MEKSDWSTYDSAMADVTSCATDSLSASRRRCRHHAGRHLSKAAKKCHTAVDPALALIYKKYVRTTIEAPFNMPVTSWYQNRREEP